MNQITRFVVLALSVSLSACSYISTPSFIQNRDKHHLKANSIAPLKMPPGTSIQQIHNEYPVSERNYPEGLKDISAVPPGLYSQ